MLAPILGVLLRIRVSGPRLPRRRTGGLIVAPNHQSWIDPILVQFSLLPHRVTFLMTDVFFDLPMAGLYFRAVGARPIREGGPSVSGMRAAREALESGEVVCIFPEGEITATGRMGKGQRGVARLARRTGAPVLPVGIRGAIHVLSKLQKTPRLAPVSVERGRVMPYDEPESKEGEERFTRRLMQQLRSLAE